MAISQLISVQSAEAAGTCSRILFDPVIRTEKLRKNMNQTTSQAAIRGGLPWWLWTMIVLTTIAIGVAAVVALTPEDPAEIYDAALQQFEQSKMEDFAVSIARLSKFPAFSDHVLLLEGMQAASQNRDPRALELFAQAEKNEQLRARVLQRKGTCYAKIGDFKNAIRAYEESLELESTNAERTRLLIAQLYYTVGALAHAQSVLDELIEAAPDNRDAVTLRGNIQSELYKYPEAIADFGSLLETPGDRAAASPELVTNYITFILQEDDTERIERAAQDFGADIPEMPLFMRLQLALGKKEEIRTNLIGARDPANPDARRLLKLEVMLAIDDGKFDEAAKSLLDALQLYPRDPEMFEMAARIFGEIGDAENVAIAEENLKQLAAIRQSFLDVINEIGNDIENADLRFQAADILVDLADPLAARRWYTVAALIDPDRKADADVAIEKLYRSYEPIVPFRSVGDDEVDDKPSVSPEEKSETEPTDKP